MTRELVSLEHQDRLAKAIEVMQNAQIRHLLVADEQGVLVGLVSDRDILRNLPYLARRPPAAPKKFREHLFLTKPAAKCLEIPLASVMTRKVLHVAPDVSIVEAADILSGKRIGCLPVLDDRDHLLGIVTVTDLMRALLGAYQPVDNSTSSREEQAVVELQATASTWKDAPI